jgi:hypothetical protein
MSVDRATDSAAPVDHRRHQTKIEFLRAHSPRWQSAVAFLVASYVNRTGVCTPGTIRRIEYLTSRLLGQPLSRRAWDKMTFNDKVAYRKFRVRDPIFTEFSDKLRMREYVLDILGPAALPALLQVADAATAFSELTGPFALKANHGSGWVILVDSQRRLTADELTQATSWLAINYESVHQEWGYRAARPLLYAEELLPGQPKDYRFYVFDGEPVMIQVEIDRFTGHRRALLDIDWSPLGSHTTYPPAAAPESAPPNLDIMLRWAARLGAGIDFVRVDLYDLGDRVVVGEMTCYPASGRAAFRPAELDAWLGSKWRWKEG